MKGEAVEIEVTSLFVLPHFSNVLPPFATSGGTDCSPYNEGTLLHWKGEGHSCLLLCLLWKPFLFFQAVVVVVFQVVKFLVKSGADLSAKNASGRTPKEEAEIVAVKCRDNESLNQTVAYLANSSLVDLTESPERSEEEESSEEEEEDQDVAKFLGSPGIQQAFEKDRSEEA